MKSAAKNSAAEAIKRATSWETLWKCQAGRGCGLVAVCYSWDMLAAIYTLGSLSLSLSLSVTPRQPVDFLGEPRQLSEW